jgi:tetratricopeptide (TPR) repeat protein
LCYRFLKITDTEAILIQVIPFLADQEPVFLPLLARGLSDLAAMRLNAVELEAQVNPDLAAKSIEEKVAQPVPDFVWNGEDLWLTGTLSGKDRFGVALALYAPGLDQVVYRSENVISGEERLMTEWERQLKEVIFYLKPNADYESNLRMHTRSLEAFISLRKGLEMLSQAKDSPSREDGLEYLFNAVAYDPDFVEAADILILFLIQNDLDKNFERSADLLERLRRIADHHPRIPLVLAEVYYQWGKFDKTSQVLEDLTEKFPRFSDGWIRRALFYHAQDQLEEALLSVQNLLAYEPENSTALDLMGAILAGKGDPAAAEEAWLRAIVVDPSRVNILTNLALLAEERDDFDKAETYYKQALQTDTDWYGVYHYYGSYCLRRQRFEEAAALLKEAIKHQPTHFPSYQNLSTALLHLERYSEAQESLLSLLRLAPDNSVRRQTLQLLNRLNDGAIKTEVRLRKLEEAWDAGDRWQTLWQLVTILFKARQRWYYWYLWGQIAGKLNLSGLGSAFYRIGLRFQPGFPLFKRLGLYYWGKGLFGKALPILRQAFQLNRSDQEIGRAYLQTLINLGEVEELQANIKNLTSVANINLNPPQISV